LDEALLNSINNKVVADLRVNDVDKFLYIWDWGEGLEFSPGTAIGPNAFGGDGYFALIQALGWAGAGFFTQPGPDLSGIDGSHYLHIAIKSPTNQLTAGFEIHLVGSTEGIILLGPENHPNAILNDKYIWYADYPHDGEWHHFDIPVSVFIDNGFTAFPSTIPGDGSNFLTLASPNVVGTELNLDAIFIYKKPAQ
jgi:hypothetical protein